MVPEVSTEEGSYASRFTVGFEKVSKSYLLLFVALLDLIDTLLRSC